MIIIGLDGVPYGLINDLAERGVMQHAASIIKGGAFKQMESSIPEVSSVAWSSIITGRNPGEHGIFGFMELAPGTYRLRFPNFRDLKVEPFWKKMDNLRSAILNVPSTYPASPMNGVLISGFVALDLEKATYPVEIVKTLKAMDYRIDVDTKKAHESLEVFIKDLNKTLDSRIALYRYLWKKEDWDIFMIVFTGTDRLFHFLWDAYEDPSHPYHTSILDYFRKIDGAIAEIEGRSNQEDSLIILSDHGFESLKWDININYILKENGFLKLRNGKEGDYSHIGAQTRAFALDPARIYINIQDKYPGGSVRLEEMASIIEELKELFSSIRIEGERVIRHIYQKEEIYHGPLLDKAPDLVLLPCKGFNLRANIKARELCGRGVFKGKHTQEDAFLLIRGVRRGIPDKPCVSDVVNIMGNLMRGLK